MPTSKGLVFDIKRFAVHDGDGLRTTVFLKGCPLRCLWCQNPEGLKPQKQGVYLQNKCIHCRICSQFKNVRYEKDRPWFLDDRLDEAIESCPSQAIAYDAKWYDVKQLMEQIKKDEVFFRYGGGVTFSGGEPFLQFEFLKTMLMACKEAGYHTAIESSFYTSLDRVKEIVPYLDRIYCDMKVFDEKKHEQYTGVSNEKIKQNIAYLLQSEHKDKVIVRTPLIPNLTGTKENVEQIAKFLSGSYEGVHYELLNYNPLAPSKYAMYDGLEYSLKEAKPFTKEEMKQFRQTASKAEIKNIVME